MIYALAIAGLCAVYAFDHCLHALRSGRPRHEVMLSAGMAICLTYVGVSTLFLAGRW